MNVVLVSGVDMTAAEEKLRDTAGYAAIADIHREMDDDQSGSIDRSESTGVGVVLLFFVLGRICFIVSLV